MTKKDKIIGAVCLLGIVAFCINMPSTQPKTAEAMVTLDRSNLISEPKKITASTSSSINENLIILNSNSSLVIESSQVESKKEAVESQKDQGKVTVETGGNDNTTSDQEIAVTRFDKPFTVKNVVLNPLRQAVKDGKINKHIGVMIASLHIIESPGTNWGAIGCNVNSITAGCQDGEGGRGYGRFGVGLTQIMSYPEWGIANKNMDTNWSVQEALQDPQKQIDVIAGLMIQKIGKDKISQDKNASQMYTLARSWLGEGCDKHGTCTTVYATEAQENYNIIWDKF
jgi:hypothetical protein